MIANGSYEVFDQGHKVPQSTRCIKIKKISQDLIGRGLESEIWDSDFRRFTLSSWIRAVQVPPQEATLIVNRVGSFQRGRRCSQPVCIYESTRYGRLPTL